MGRGLIDLYDASNIEKVRGKILSRFFKEMTVYRRFSYIPIRKKNGLVNHIQLALRASIASAAKMEGLQKVLSADVGLLSGPCCD